MRIYSPCHNSCHNVARTSSPIGALAVGPDVNAAASLAATLIRPCAPNIESRHWFQSMNRNLVKFPTLIYCVCRSQIKRCWHALTGELLSRLQPAFQVPDCPFFLSLPFGLFKFLSSLTTRAKTRSLGPPTWATPTWPRRAQSPSTRLRRGRSRISMIRISATTPMSPVTL